MDDGARKATYAKRVEELEGVVLELPDLDIISNKRAASGLLNRVSAALESLIDAKVMFFHDADFPEDYLVLAVFVDAGGGRVKISDVHYVAPWEGLDREYRGMLECVDECQVARCLSAMHVWTTDSWTEIPKFGTVRELEMKVELGFAPPHGTDSTHPDHWDILHKLDSLLKAVEETDGKWEEYKQ